MLSSSILSACRCPERLYRRFEEICAIPRGSGSESGIADYLCAFATARGLPFARDEANNVAIYAPASPGYEDEPPLALQAHSDMVCEAEEGVRHDFSRDPIIPVFDRGVVRASGTTLGADDGAGVAIALALLDDETAPHPPLTCLFTTSEETGMGGVLALDPAMLRAEHLLNLDSEEEGVAIVSCAGGLGSHFTLPGEPVPFAGEALAVEISGLFGGHSGQDIGENRANAILLMGRLLTLLYREQVCNLVEFSGGGKHNAIPRTCRATIAVQDRPAAMARLRQLAEELRPTLSREDAGLRVKVAKHPPQERMQSYRVSSRVLSFLSLLPNGALARSQTLPGFVETSSNLGIARGTSDAFTFDVYSRAADDAELIYLGERLARLAKVCAMDYRAGERTPGWRPDPSSHLRETYLRAYKKVYASFALEEGENSEERASSGSRGEGSAGGGKFAASGEGAGVMTAERGNGERVALDLALPPPKEARVTGIHAGLECGVLLTKMGGGDALSIGPTLRHVHTPAEEMDLPSLGRTYRLVAEMLAEKSGG